MNPTPEQAIEWRSDDLRFFHANQEAYPTTPLVEVIRSGRVVAVLLPSEEDDSQSIAIRMAPLFNADIVLTMIDISTEDGDLGGLPLPEDAEGMLVFNAYAPDGESSGAIYPYDKHGNYYEFPSEMKIEVDGLQGELVREGFEKTSYFKPMIEAVRGTIGLDEFEARVREDCAITKLLLHAGVVVSLISEVGARDIISESFEDFECQVIHPDDDGPDPSMN